MGQSQSQKQHKQSCGLCSDCRQPPLGSRTTRSQNDSRHFRSPTTSPSFINISSEVGPRSQRQGEVSRSEAEGGPLSGFSEDAQLAMAMHLSNLQLVEERKKLRSQGYRTNNFSNDSRGGDHGRWRGRGRVRGNYNCRGQGRGRGGSPGCEEQPCGSTDNRNYTKGINRRGHSRGCGRGRGGGGLAYCVICLGERAVMAVTPCGHLCLCSSCGQRKESLNSMCPICRGPLGSIIRIYQP